MWEWLQKWIGNTDIPGIPVVSENYVQFNAWAPLVAARGNTVTRMPSGPNVGQLAERYIDGQGVYRYALAPANVRAEDAETGYALQVQMNSGQLATTATDTLKGIVDAPRNTVAGLLGIPPWAVTVILIGVGFLVLNSVLDGRATQIVRSRK